MKWRDWRAKEWLLGIATAGLICACSEQQNDKPSEPAKASPNASIVPQPLLSAKSLVVTPTPSSTGTGTGTGTTRQPHSKTKRKVEAPPPVPVPFRPGEKITELTKTSRATTPLLLEATFSRPGLKTEPHFYDLERDEKVAAMANLKLSFSADLRAENRLRIELKSQSFPLPRGTTILARADRFGFILGWPERNIHRLLPQGMLRTIFTELRTDATPLLNSIPKTLSSSKRFGLASETAELITSHGKMQIEQVELPGLGFGGALLCRFLLELLAVAPTSRVCSVDRVPTSVNYQFTNGGELRYNVIQFERKPETSKPLPRVPPPRANWVFNGLPKPPKASLTEQQLAALKRGAKDGERGVLTFENFTYHAAYLIADGTPLAIAPPRTTKKLRGLRPGDYHLSYVNFFGQQVHPPNVAKVPGTTRAGARQSDAGAP